MKPLEVVGQIADLKDVDYKTNLLLAALIEVLSEKGIVGTEELKRKARAMDLISELEISAQQEPPMPPKAE